MAIEDFGQKIGGAKKDLWKTRGLAITDLAEMNAAEKEKYIKKDNIWPKPDYAQMLNEEGYDRTALFFIKTMRDSISPTPSFRVGDSEEERAQKQEEYIKFIHKFKEDLLKIKTAKDVDKMGFDYLKENGYVEERGYHSYCIPEGKETFINHKITKNIQAGSSYVKNEAMKKGFLADQPKAMKEEFLVLPIGDKVTIDKAQDASGKDRITIANGWSRAYFYTSDKTMGRDMLKDGNFVVLHQSNVLCGAQSQEAAEKFVDMIINKMLEIKNEKEGEEVGDTSNRKTKLVPKPLENIERTPNDRVFHVQGQDFIDEFKIKGGEFGNWVNENERQQNMNFAFDSFKDIASALDIKDEDVSLGGRLNIAFGARGHGAALAHYEPLREVINLTRMKGAGSLGHEYFHAMDDIAGKTLGLDKMATAERPFRYTVKTSGYKAREFYDNAFSILVDKMKYKEVKDEAAIRAKYEGKIKEAEKDHADLVKRTEEYIKKVLPDEKLTPEQISRRNDIWAKMLENAATWDRGKFKSDEYDELNKLNKEVTGYVFSADVKKILPNWQYFIHDYKDRANYLKEEMQKEIDKGEPIRVETDFYKNARKLDTMYSKDSSGYWAENHEMAARAFACYLHDKLAEQGIKNDYLTGHAFFDQMTYPSKEERQEINKAFDEVIEYMKDLEIIHDRDKEVEIADISIEADRTTTATVILDGVENKVSISDGELTINDNSPDSRYINRHKEEIMEAVNDAMNDKTKQKGIDR